MQSKLLALQPSAPSRSRCRAGAWTRRSCQSTDCPAAVLVCEFASTRAQRLEQAVCTEKHAHGVPKGGALQRPPSSSKPPDKAMHCLLGTHLQRRIDQLHGLLAMLHLDGSHHLAAAVQHLCSGGGRRAETRLSHIQMSTAYGLSLMQCESLGSSWRAAGEQHSSSRGTQCKWRAASGCAAAQRSPPWMRRAGRQSRSARSGRWRGPPACPLQGLGACWRPI